MSKIIKVSKTTDKTKQRLLEEAVATLVFLRHVNSAYEQLAKDKKRMTEEHAERSVWDTTLQDGIHEHGD